MCAVQTRPGRARRVLDVTALATVIAIAACTDEPTATRSGITASVSDPLSGGFEGEFFGNMWSNGVVSRDPAYYADLEPFDQATANRLRYYNATTWADTSVGHTGGARWMFEWSDPKAGGNCGNLATYLAGDTTKPSGQGGRWPEIHRPAPNVAPAGVEKHCIRPGRYTLIIRHGGSITKQVLLDYLPIVPSSPGANGAKFIWNVTAQRSEVLEALNYDDTTSVWQDLVAQVDVTGGSYSETRVLDVENALGKPAKDTFTNVAAPTGTELDYFRFSVARDASTWNLNNQGTMLTRLYWTYGVVGWQARRTGFFDAGHTVGLPIIRPHAFSADVTQSGMDTVAVELMRPDEQPDSSTVTKRTLQITRTTPVACASFEGVTTWQVTDQYLNASCSTRGANIQYRWQSDAGGAWTPYSTDTLYDFGGHGATGTHQVTLQVKNTSTGTSSTQTTPVGVQTGQVTLTGQTFITVKTAYVYRSNHWGQWFERYNPDLRWYPSTAGMQDTLRRIWPAGNYTEELRQDSSTSVLRRGRLHITVCIPSSGCALAASQAATPSTSAGDSSGIFGAGPWISWGTGAGRRVARLYDLWGNHDPASPFATTAWMTVAGGRVQDPTGSWELAWSRRSNNFTGVQLFDFMLVPREASPFAFGFALDPDLGADPADDAAGYAGDLGLIFVTDGDGALGILLLDGSGNAITTIEQYGVGHPAPHTTVEAWNSLHDAVGTMLPGPRDVQLLARAAPPTGPTTYTLAILRGTSLADLRAKANAVITALGSPPN